MANRYTAIPTDIPPNGADASPPSGLRFTRWRAIMATALLATSHIAATDASSSCELTVKFCESDGRLVVRAYNGDDTAQTTEYDKLTVKAGTQGQVSCEHDSECGISVEMYGHIGNASPVNRYRCGTAVYIGAQVSWIDGSTIYDYAFSTISCF